MELVFSDACVISRYWGYISQVRIFQSQKKKISISPSLVWFTLLKAGGIRDPTDVSHLIVVIDH